MDFGLSEEQQLLQQTARDFLSAECGSDLLRQSLESEGGHPEALYRKMSQMGWTGILVPERYGGLGLGMLEAVLLASEGGRVALPGPFLSSSILATAAIERAGNVAQKKRWLPALAGGEALGSVAWLEEGGRLDAAGIGMRARKTRGGYVLDGTKLFVPYAQEADFLIVPARIGSGGGEAGITLFLVVVPSPLIIVEPLRTVDRTRRAYEVHLRGVEVPADAVLGEAGRGWAVLTRLLDLAATALAADGIGGSERVLEMATDYAKQRQQFGRPIASFQAIKHLAAEMVARIEPSRSLVWYAGHACDRRPREASRAASMAKARLSEVFSWCATTAVQIHGGIGFTWEHDIHVWFKRAKANELSFGDPAFHRDRSARFAGF
ncbi:MAG: hypothetical protein QOD06_1808 [Candidatus Binatota bacterium]|jgi:alkylation response protein AidB-like acyl-CoA dehydrogenase|nr:hypothetical protein [Candidatus Binatota bacterium]